MCISLNGSSCCIVKGFRFPHHVPTSRPHHIRPSTTSPTPFFLKKGWCCGGEIMRLQKAFTWRCHLHRIGSWVYNSRPIRHWQGFNQIMTWIVARTEPKREKVAVNFIQRQGRVSYLPLCRDPISQVIMPLFPSYLFVFNIDGAWHWLQRTFGISHLVMRCGLPDLMADHTLESLRKMERSDGLIPLQRFLPGDRVNIVDCAFSGWSGIFQNHVKDRCSVLLEMLGQSVPVSLKMENLKTAA
jgi:transcription antitermination factor NusG